MKIKRLDRLTERVEQAHQILDEIEALETFKMVANKSAIITTVIGPDYAMSVDDLFTADEVEEKINEKINVLRKEFKSL